MHSGIGFVRLQIHGGRTVALQRNHQTSPLMPLTRSLETMIHHILLSIFLYFAWQSQVSFSASENHLCRGDEALSLLNFKQMFTISASSNASITCDSHGQVSYPKTRSWNQNSDDCCRWDGVTCDNLTGFVIGLDLSCSQLQGTFPLNSSLFQLSRMETLNLAYNDFSGSEIPHELGSLARLTHLNLSSANFSGEVPSEMSHLSRLISLDLSSPSSSTAQNLKFEGESFTVLLQNLTRPEVLLLDYVNISEVLRKNLSSFLIQLSLYQTGLHGKLPSNVFHLPNLQTLDLGGNEDLGGPLPVVNQTAVRSLEWFSVRNTGISGELPDSIGYMRSLAYLGIQGCNFSGFIPESIGNMTEIIQMDLSNNHFNGHIPSTVSHLNKLISLNLSRNNFEGQIPDAFGNLQKLTFLDLCINTFTGQIPYSMTNLSQLELLSLSRNSISGPIPSRASDLQKLDKLNLDSNLLNGTIPSWLLSHPLLATILLSNNQLTGQIDDFDSKTLKHIDFSNNQLQGPIPQSISALLNLTSLDLSWNKFDGSVEMAMFSNLSKLEDLDLSYNSLSLIMSNNVPLKFPFLKSLSLSSCEVKEFPKLLRTSDQLRWVDLSNNQVQGEIPHWFSTMWPESLKYLNFSHNFLTGLRLPSWNMELWCLDLQSNLLQGSLPSSICNLHELYILNLSGNKLTGTLPPCLGNFSIHLSVLNLRGNSFSGVIPDVAKNNSLKIIGLTGNKLEGPLPRSLTYCTHLEVFDVANNNINDTFPWWLEVLPELQVMILRSNKFHGSIGMSRAKCPFPKLRVIEFACNNFNGPLPAKLFENLEAMKNTSARSTKVTYMSVSGADLDFIYQDSVILVFKGIEAKLYGVSKTCTNINLSNNKFEGVIPESLGNLPLLLGINVSHNQLTGRIPSALKNLKVLETLDLSWNRLEGEIPRELASLTFLQVLNLSQNYLVGPIPGGNQFKTFQNSSYGGNLALCGFPLSVECDEIKPPSDSGTEDEEGFFNGFTWEAVAIGYCFGMFLGLFMGSLVFLTGKPSWFIRFVERVLIMKLIKKPLARMKNK